MKSTMYLDREHGLANSLLTAKLGRMVGCFEEKNEARRRAEGRAEPLPSPKRQRGGPTTNLGSQRTRGGSVQGFKVSALLGR